MDISTDCSVDVFPELLLLVEARAVYCIAGSRERVGGSLLFTGALFNCIEGFGIDGCGAFEDI